MIDPIIFSLQEMDDSQSLILISALTSSQLHLKMEETNEEIDIDDSVTDNHERKSSQGNVKQAVWSFMFP